MSTKRFPARALVGTVLILGAARSLSPVRAEPLYLANYGQTAYRIVSPVQADASTKAAAADLGALLQRIASTTFPSDTDASTTHASEIILGQENTRLRVTGVDRKLEALPEGGYLISSFQGRLVAAGPGRGTVNAIYDFLRVSCDCRWFTPTLSVIPEEQKLEVWIPRGSVVARPSFEFRGLDTGRTMPEPEGVWAARQRLNGFVGDAAAAATTEPLLAAGTWLQAGPRTATLVPGVLLERRSFRRHPDYFAERDGERRRDHAQLCWSNSDLPAVVAAKAATWLKANPKARLLALHPGDNEEYCECEDCRRLAAELGGGATGASALYYSFATKTAALIGAEYPQVRITVLAGDAALAPPPATIEFPSNVVLLYAPTSVCVHHALYECDRNRDANRDFLGHLDDWVRRAPRVYLVLTAHGAQPFGLMADMRAWQANLRLAQQQEVKGVLVRTGPGDGTAPVHMHWLREYLLAQLLWEPNLDLLAAMQEFADAYYGKAASEMVEFLQILNRADSYRPEAAPEEGGADPTFHAAAGTDIGALSMASLEKLDALFDAAEAKVKQDKELSKRVKRERLCLDYHILKHLAAGETLREKAATDFRAFAGLAGADWTLLPADGRRVSVEEFVRECIGEEEEAE